MKEYNMGLLHPKGQIRVTTTAVGHRTEAHIIARCMAVGYNVLKPVAGDLRYDLVIEDADGQFWRVQCKTGRIEEGGAVIRFWCRSNTRGEKRGLHYKGQVDYFAVYSPDLNTVYLVPANDLPETVGTLRFKENRKFKEHGGGGGRWAQDYEL